MSHKEKTCGSPTDYTRLYLARNSSTSRCIVHTSWPRPLPNGRSDRESESCDYNSTYPVRFLGVCSIVCKTDINVDTHNNTTPSSAIRPRNRCLRRLSNTSMIIGKRSILRADPAGVHLRNPNSTPSWRSSRRRLCKNGRPYII